MTMRSEGDDEHELERADSEAPVKCIIDGKVVHLDDTYGTREIGTATALERAAQKSMEMSLPNAAATLFEAIGRFGPMIGSQIIQKGLRRSSGGDPGKKNWTPLFRYVCRHYGILRYTTLPNGNGHSRFCTLAQALMHRSPCP